MSDNTKPSEYADAAMRDFIRQNMKRYDGDEGFKDLYCFRPGETIVEVDNEDDAITAIIAARASQGKSNG